jgi:Ca2+-transporting ATPase
MAEERVILIEDVIEEDDEETHYNTGLTSAQTASRLKRFGKNAIDSSKVGPGILAIVWEEVREPMILLLLVVAVLYSILGTPMDAVGSVT